MTDASTLFDRLPPRPEPQLAVIPARASEHERVELPWGVLLRTVASAPTLPRIVTEVLLPRRGGRVEVKVVLDKDPELAKESVYVAFPFAAERPRIRYSRQVGFVDPTRDHLPGAGNEWICTGDWITVTDEVDGHTIAWTSESAPLVTVGAIVRGAWPEAFTPDGMLLSWVMNNYWWTNYAPSQGGHLELAYAFEPMACFDPVRAHRLARDVRMTRLVQECRPIDKFGRSGGPLARSGRLLDVRCSPNVDATVVTGPLDATPMIRLRELAGRPGRATAGDDWMLVPCHPVTGIPTGAPSRVVHLGRHGVVSCRIERSSPQLPPPVASRRPSNPEVAR